MSVNCRKALKQHIGFPPFFPTQIYIRSVTTLESFEARYGTRFEKDERRPTWSPAIAKPFEELSILTAIVEINDLAGDLNLIAISLPGYPYFALIHQIKRSEQGNRVFIECFCITYS